MTPQQLLNDLLNSESFDELVADQISETMGKLFPVSWEALMEEAH